MSRIRILPEILSNKIAAGEVVERPASVVKELMENALDAASRRITVAVDQGGKSVIRVSDDGAGMGHDDALLALERYATSKIYRDRDLFDIRTLGFRGEALPSIAAVSRFSMVTRERDAEAGTEIWVDGGKIRQVAETGAPAGTMITVNRLFYNTPARRKFLKTVNTEFGHVADTFSVTAMGWPSVRFRLIHNRREVKTWSAAPDPADRVADVLGSHVRPYLLPMASESPGISISGWAVAPGISRSTAGGIYLYVNGRFVRDRVVRHALFQGYAGRLMKGRFPVAVLFLQVPFDRVDVNVHPSKHEIRFADPKAVHDAVADAVADALSRQDRRPPGVAGGKPNGAGDRETGPREYARTAAASEIPAGAGTAVAGGKTRQTTVAEAIPAYAGQDREGITVSDGPAHTGHRPSETRSAARGPRDTAPATQAALWAGSPLADARIIGQFRETYIVLETDAGLVLVDQHAAHERIVFEHLKNRSATITANVQKLLMPETIELGYREADAMEKLAAPLADLGFEIEPFGGNAFVIKSVPALLSGRDIRPLIVEIVETAVAIGFAARMEKVLEPCLMLMACHGAIRANQRLTEPEIRRLLADLDRCGNPAHCPHGRPTWIRWTERDLEKAFGRIV